MNIFLDKSLPKRTKIILNIVRVILLVMIFGGLFYSMYNPAATDILLYLGIFLGCAFGIGNKIINRRKKNSAAQEQLNNNTECTSDPDKSRDKLR